MKVKVRVKVKSKQVGSCSELWQTNVMKMKVEVKAKSKQAGSCSELMADKYDESESKNEKQAGRFLLRAEADKYDASAW